VPVPGRGVRPGHCGRRRGLGPDGGWRGRRRRLMTWRNADAGLRFLAGIRRIAESKKKIPLPPTAYWWGRLGRSGSDSWRAGQRAARGGMGPARGHGPAVDLLELGDLVLLAWLSVFCPPVWASSCDYCSAAGAPAARAWVVFDLRLRGSRCATRVGRRTPLDRDHVLRRGDRGPRQ